MHEQHFLFLHDAKAPLFVINMMNDRATLPFIEVMHQQHPYC